MASSRWILFVKVLGNPEWVQHMIFVSRSDAEIHGCALKTMVIQVEDYRVEEAFRDDASGCL
jgi:hypothetical protein